MLKKPQTSTRKLPTLQRQVMDVSTLDLVTTAYLQSDQSLPLLIQPALDGVDLNAWAETNRAWIETELGRHGGILFRGFHVPDVATFEQFIDAVSGGALRYQERSSPRSQVSGNIYTSTDHPASESIFLHNEQSYNLTFPLKILFYCVTAAQEGGETPIASSRRMYQRIPHHVRQKFADKGYMYVRNFGSGFGLTWQEAFQTEDKAAVEAYCQANDIEFEWREGDRLRTRQVRQAVIRHPQTGDMVWFNHATFFHVSTLRLEVQQMLAQVFSEEELPNNTYYGDGSPIEPDVLDTLRQLYAAETVAFPWQKGDILLLDNVLTAHGRSPFVGPRKIVVGMADPYKWAEA